MAFNPEKFERVRRLAEAIPGSHRTDVLGSDLLMICDELARLIAVPEETTSYCGIHQKRDPNCQLCRVSPVKTHSGERK